ncbi:MAG: acyl carrier protein [Eubacteriales bacterium]
MKEDIIEILTDICGELDFEGETALVDDGILESLEIVTMVTDLMEAFDIELDVLDLTPDHFNSVDAIMALVQSKL